MTNRREFLRNASLMAATGVWAANSNVSAATVSAISKSNANKNFGLQIWSIQRELPNDVPGGLKKLAEMGYSFIELALYNAESGNIWNLPIADFKKLADAAGLKIISSHVGLPVRGAFNLQNFASGRDTWKKTCDDHASIGCKYIFQPGEPPMRSVEDVAMVGEVFNEAGKIAKAAGLIFGFHNHAGEFQYVTPGGTEKLCLGVSRRGLPEGSKVIFDGMMEATDPELVKFQLDVYWAVMGLNDPVAVMRKYPDRIRVLHIKDVGVLGESGLMNFQKIYETAYANNIEDFIVELEGNTGLTQFEGVKRCADYLLNASFAK